MNTNRFIIYQKVDDFIHQISINRPERKNALNTALLIEIADRLDEIIAASGRVVIISGVEGNFAAGADIDEIADLSPQQALLDARVAAWQRIRSCPIPLIAVVQGYCLGGGVELLLSCDFALADKTVQVGLPEVTLGIMPGAGGTQILPRIVGKARAAQMVYSGQIYPIERIADWGLVSEIVDGDVMSYAQKVAKKISRNAPFAIRQAKQSLLQSQEVGQEDGLKFERQAFSLLSSTTDKGEGIRAFKEKRQTKFRGQ